MKNGLSNSRSGESAVAVLDAPDGPELLTLKQVAEALEMLDPPVKIGLPSLCDMVNARDRDISDQLGAVEVGHKRMYPPKAVEILHRFLPEFRASKLGQVLAPDSLRAFLRNGNIGIGGVNAMVPVNPGVREMANTLEDAIKVAEARGRAEGLAAQERVLTAAQAADLLQVSTRSLRKSFPAHRRTSSATSGDRWLYSRLMAEFSS